jgi:hypothetical protein
VVAACVEAFFQVKKTFTADDLIALDKIIADTIASKNSKDKPLAYPRLDKKQQQQQAEQKKVLLEARPVSNSTHSTLLMRAKRLPNFSHMYTSVLFI